MKRALFILLFLLAQASCAKFHYDINDRLTVKVNIVMNIEQKIDADIDYGKDLIYEWDEAEYGKIVEKKLDTVVCLIFDEYKNFVDSEEVVIGTPKKLNLKYPNKYSILFRNKTYGTSYVQSEGDVISSPGYLYDVPEFNFSEQHSKVNQCEEQYSAYEQNIFSVFNEKELEEYEKTFDNDTTITYYCYAYKTLHPVSYVYIFQIVIYDDDESVPMLVKECDYIGINGVACEAEMIGGNNGENAGLIETVDIKPFQYKDNYAVCCSKVIMYGLPYSKESSWDENGSCEFGVQFTLSNGNKKRGRVSIANKIEEKPKGGVITLSLNNSQICGGNENNGVDIDVVVDKWEEYVIDIPF